MSPVNTPMCVAGRRRREKLSLVPSSDLLSLVHKISHVVAKRIDFFPIYGYLYLCYAQAKRNKERDNFCKCDINGKRQGKRHKWGWQKIAAASSKASDQRWTEAINSAFSSYFSSSQHRTILTFYRLLPSPSPPPLLLLWRGSIVFLRFWLRVKCKASTRVWLRSIRFFSAVKHVRVRRRCAVVRTRRHISNGVSWARRRHHTQMNRPKKIKLKIKN